ncbi:ABC transporter permease [Caldisalinibacter kiritimatiensis]|uniref:Cell division protein FtsX n=1 Tax=Caldisalinibacter kiritimatiensis TaxID=1304284 RepID=R1CXS8_9FIRM|nr:ABC transporter permease [Caldisalinibacter kiritimatiensis]EOD01409.1 Cell division protein FtsX [Caldisalinibacter kiritimatiensis]
MNILESFRIAISSLLANKMRSFLTMLGIIIGIASVITIVSLGQGSQATIGNEFEKIGTNRVIFGMNWGENPRYQDRFDEYDLATIKRIFKDDIKAISPIMSTNGEALSGREKGSIYIIGVNEDYSKIQNFDMVKGRFLLESDVKGERNVCVIDKKLAMDLFKRTDVLGEKIMVDTGFSKIALLVCGVYETPPSTFDKLNQQLAGDIPTQLYAPVTLMKKLRMGSRYYSFEISVLDNKNVNKLTDNIIKVIEKRHRNEGKNYYRVQTAQQVMDIFNNILGVLSGVIGAIAAISLLVGGIGVMNIMLVSVTERTREIGIRKAIGATRKDILIQFLIESMLITGIGGIIGTAFGLGIQALIAMSLGIPPSISIITILIAVIFSTIVGVISGLYPANKAAKLDPILALRYE